MLNEVLPQPEQALELPPEELAVFILKFLALQHQDQSGQLNRYNFMLSSNVIPYSGRELSDKMARVFMEAWIWLEREGFLAPKPGDTGNWVFITRRGHQLIESLKASDFKAYQLGDLLPSKNLDPVLVKDVRPLFLRGDYDTAIFRAFKEVEVRVRKASKLAPEDIGVQLMRKAFDSKTGLLTDTTAPVAERENLAHLFAGAIGVFKNPSSHREVKIYDPVVVVEAIMFADMLLRFVSVQDTMNELMGIDGAEQRPGKSKSKRTGVAK